MAPQPDSWPAPIGAEEPLLMVGEDHSDVPMKALLDEGADPPPLPNAPNHPPEGAVPMQIKWRNVFIIAAMHLMLLYALTYVPSVMWQTGLFTWIMRQFAGFGVTGGAHRYWTHRSYKAKQPLRILMMLGFGMAGMNNLFDWVRDHRVHHKFSETDADPHNARRGFFFSHVGWLMVKKHPEVVRRGQTVDLSDILADPVVTFERKHHTKLFYLLCFVIPILLPVYGWSESWTCSIAACVIRWITGINSVWSVNSAAHLYGSHPFNRYINPADNRLLALWCMGEGWHNYHHVFPWDYKASEFGFFNPTMQLIRFCSLFGWAYDLKSAPKSLVRRVVTRYGDGSHPDWATYAPEIPEAAAENLSVVDRLRSPSAEGEVQKAA